MTFVIETYNSFARGEITRDAMIETLKTQPWQYGRVLGPGVAHYIPGDTDEFARLYLDQHLLSDAEATDILNSLPVLPADHEVMTSARKWEGEDAVIEFETAPWLQIGDALVDVGLATKHWDVAEGNPCSTCAGSKLLGALFPHNGYFCIERCDECELYPGDLHAARAVAARIGEHVAVWYEPAFVDKNV